MSFEHCVSLQAQCCRQTDSTHQARVRTKEGSTHRDQSRSLHVRGMPHLSDRPLSEEFWASLLSVLKPTPSPEDSEAAKLLFELPSSAVCASSAVAAGPAVGPGRMPQDGMSFL